MKYKFEQLDVVKNEHYLAVDKIQEWSKEWRTMRAYSFSQLLRHPLGLLAFAQEKNKFQKEYSSRFAGHIAITEIQQIEQRSFAKIGALAVGEDYRGNGLASALVGELIKTSSETLPGIDGYYAYVHPDSLSAFLDNGANVVGARHTIAPPTGCNIIVSIAGEG